MSVLSPVDMIRLVLRNAGVNGVGQDPNAEDNNDVLSVWNMMLGEWASERFMCFHLIDATCTATGAQSYTVGHGGQFVSATTAEPVSYVDRIEAAFWRSYSNPSQPVDYPLLVIEAREDWNAIAVKTAGTWPSYIFFDSDTPLGSVWPWPVPVSGTGELHLSLRVPLNQITDLTTPLVLPQAYQNAMMWGLSVRVRPMYQLDRDEKIERLAAGALAVVRANNAQIPRMRMPAILQSRRGRYNVYSDTFR